MTEPSHTIKNHAAFIWSVADKLRGVYKQSEYGKVILPLTVLRRLDCVLEPNKAKVLAVYEQFGDRPDFLRSAAEVPFYNTSKLTLTRLLDTPDDLADQLKVYLGAFSEDARDVLEKFEFDKQITKLGRSNLLYLVVSLFCEIDLHPDTVSNIEMGYLYEELIRKFSELSNETAGEHFTPREVIRLMVDLLLTDDPDLAKPGIMKSMLDPACGTGGMLYTAEHRLRELNPHATLRLSGQELNEETYAVARSDFMVKGEDAEIAFGNSFTQDGFEDEQFDYLLANPPFGVEWKMVADKIKQEHVDKGFDGRFGAGLPRINDGSFLFLQHMISKMRRPNRGGGRLAIVFNGSPLFTGAAGSGESEIRRWIIENDWLEAVVALPDQLFYNTGISTYFWIVTNRKSKQRQGKVQLIDARDYFVKMRKSLGDKRKEMSPEQIDEIVRLHHDFTEGDKVKIFPNESFGFLRITVERPLRLRWEVTEETRAKFVVDKKIAKLSAEVREALLTGLDRWGDEVITDKPVARKKVTELMAGAGQRGKALQDALLDALSVRDPDAPPVLDDEGAQVPDPDLRDYENVPLPDVQVTFEADVTARLSTVEYETAVNDYLTAEVLSYVPDAWIDHDKTKIGYEIPLTRQFYKYVPPRPLEEIDIEIKQLEKEIQVLLAEVTE
ncbi:type I restriction-modification system subunit M [Amycolatopsis tolypomycina]|uniref:type I restriction-modification system subunit M n=1 Tax=Amycolatopsis tolypomycina TaxID=208445 RepID=UPI0033AEBF6D